MAFQALPDAQYDTPTWPQNTVHFHKGGMPVTEEHQSKLAQYQVKVTIWEWEFLSWA
jgi:hypothetical protein